jgi:hypothetical protein
MNQNLTILKKIFKQSFKKKMKKVMEHPSLWVSFNQWYPRRVNYTNLEVILIIKIPFNNLIIYQIKYPINSLINCLLEFLNIPTYLQNKSTKIYPTLSDKINFSLFKNFFTKQIPLIYNQNKESKLNKKMTLNINKSKVQKLKIKMKQTTNLIN